MKKILCLTLALTLLIGALVIPCAAVFGSGVSSLAEGECVIKTTLKGEKITFSDKDFKRAFATDAFRSITVRSLPKSTEGTLMYNGRRVGIGQTIHRRNLSALVFIPASKNVEECSFLFTSDRIFGGEEISLVMKFIDKVNYAPVAKSVEYPLEAWTQSGIALYTNLNGTDPEGDEISVMILEYPKHGTLTETAEGVFRYVSRDGYEGQDSFRYCLRDCYGNYSAIETVELTVAAPRSSVRFFDMEDDPTHNAAIVMSGAGIMSGTVMGDHHLFMPEEGVTRAEFVAMAMKRAGLRADSTLKSTHFDDNDQIPASLVSYVATAARMGIISGSFEGTSLLVRPNDAVTPTECAMILYNIYSPEAGDETVDALPDTIPVWAKVGVSAMLKNHLLDSETLQKSSMTRSDVAELLFRLEGLKRR